MGPESMPFPIDGIEGIQNRIKYPQEALENGIEGKVYVLANIDEQGDVKKAQVIRGIGVGCDEEALKVVKETKFSPGICNGEPCKVQISVPIVFSLVLKDKTIEK
jgi:protein TonB